MFFLKNSKGITLVALVVTIIVLIILTGITISSITSDEGEIKKADEAAKGAEIEDEKEIISVSVVQAIKSDNNGNVTLENLKQEIAINTDREVEITEEAEEFLLTFKDSGRVYQVGIDGSVKLKNE